MYGNIPVEKVLENNYKYNVDKYKVATGMQRCPSGMHDCGCFLPQYPRVKRDQYLNYPYELAKDFLQPYGYLLSRSP